MFSRVFTFFMFFITFQGQILTVSLSPNQDTALILAVKSGNQKEVKRLLKSGVEVNSLGHDYKTALDLAVEYGYNKIILDLIRYNARVTCHDNQEYLEQFFISKARWRKFAFAALIGISFLLIMPNAGLLMAAIMSTNAGSMTFATIALGFMAVESVLIIHGLLSIWSQIYRWKDKSEQSWMLPIL